MRIFTQQRKFASRRQSGLSLLEMMVATSLLVVMMLGLTAMFNQTQRAFRSGLKQVDVFEGGRAVMEIIVRDIEQMAASKITNNLYAGPYPSYPANVTLKQALPSGGVRTNILFGAYFLNHGPDWSAMCYRVLHSDANFINTNIVVVGSLYRFAEPVTDFGQTNYLNQFLFTNPSQLMNKVRLIDGVVHFRLQFYDNAGRLVITNQLPSVSVQTNNATGERITLFNNETLPAMVEVELGIVEPQTLEQVRSMPAASQRAYLERQVGKVHIFRQQIPIRNVQR